MKRRNIIVAACFLAYTLIIILPPLIYHYVYPNLNDDFATNVYYLSNQNLWMLTYYSYIYIGYPLRWIHALSNIPYYQLYMWFSYAVLVGVGYCWYFVLSKLVDYKAGLIALALSFFCAMGLVTQFASGNMFDMMNIGIVLPFLIYFTIKWYQERQRYQLVLSLVLAFIFSNFHYNGIYLSPIVAACLVLYYGYSLYKKYAIDQKLLYLFLSFITIGTLSQYALISPARLANGLYKAYHFVVASPTKLYLYYVSLGLVFIIFIIISLYHKKPQKFSILSLTVFLISVGFNLILAYSIFKKESYDMVWSAVANRPNPTTINVFSLVSAINTLDIFLLILLGFAIYTVWGKIRDKSILFVLGIISVALLVPSLMSLVQSGDRPVDDVATIIAAMTAIFVARSWKSNYIKVTLIIVLAVGIYNILPQWFSYKSAVTNVDKEAFAYLNTLDDKTFTTSSQVQPFIYDIYIKEQYQQDSKEVLITRNIPMTPESTIGIITYITHGIEGTEGFTLVKSFTDGKIVVNIYEGKK